MLPIVDDSGRPRRLQPRSPRNPAIASLTFFCLLVLSFVGQQVLASGIFLVPAGLAFVPGALFGGVELSGGVPVIPPPATLVTYQFLHASWLHLIGNLLFLWVFGPRVERTLGPGRWTVLLLTCGVGAALAQAWPEPSSPVAMVGSSGGISGILGAYLFLHPRAEMRLLVPLVPMMRLPAWMLLVAWFVLQLLYTNWTETAPGGVAFRAHIGGFVCGLLLAPVLHSMASLSAEARTVVGTLRIRDSRH